ncbi:MAG: hypothetical protein PUB96_00535, partial [Helicobacteraceae bacterium]|nr:hypothetical protein [Helicobacteraceae bacterium]
VKTHLALIFAQSLNKKLGHLQKVSSLALCLTITQISLRYGFSQAKSVLGFHSHFVILSVSEKSNNNYFFRYFATPSMTICKLAILRFRLSYLIFCLMESKNALMLSLRDLPKASRGNLDLNKNKALEFFTTLTMTKNNVCHDLLRKAFNDKWRDSCKNSRNNKAEYLHFRPPLPTNYTSHSVSYTRSAA